jgi:plasmid stability protein
VGSKKVTITLDEDVVRWVRIRAAERGTSLSRLVGELLREKMLGEQSYEAAMREYLARPTRKLKSTMVRYPRRAELYSR